eukprot:6271256-Amphidinium_carterae.1
MLAQDDKLTLSFLVATSFQRHTGQVHRKTGCYVQVRAQVIDLECAENKDTLQALSTSSLKVSPAEWLLLLRGIGVLDMSGRPPNPNAEFFTEMHCSQRLT